MSDEIPIPETDEPADLRPAEAAWKRWSQSPTPESLAGALKALKPTLDRAVRRNPGVNPAVLGGEAKRLAIQAIKSYDPERGTALSSHVFNHLLPLGRHTRDMTKIVPMPRSSVDDASHYRQGIRDFYEENNREPNDDEMSDLFKLDRPGLARLHRITRGEFAEGQLESEPEVEREDPRLTLWADFVYHDLNPQDKSIMDYKTGRNEHPILSSQEVADKLGLHVTYINRRAADISRQILDGLNSTRKGE